MFTLYLHTRRSSHSRTLQSLDCLVLRCVRRRFSLLGLWSVRRVFVQSEERVASDVSLCVDLSINMLPCGVFGWYYSLAFIRWFCRHSFYFHIRMKCAVLLLCARMKRVCGNEISSTSTLLLAFSMRRDVQQLGRSLTVGDSFQRISPKIWNHVSSFNGFIRPLSLRDFDFVLIFLSQNIKLKSVYVRVK